MKGIEIKVPGGRFIRADNATVIISNKEEALRLTFGGVDKGNPDISYTYYTRDLMLGDKIRIRFYDMSEDKLSLPEKIIDHSDSGVVDSLILSKYLKLRKKLLEEGIINENE